MMTTVDQEALTRGRLLTIPEAASYLRVSETTIRRMVRQGSLPHRRIGTQIRFAWSDVEAASARTDGHPAALPTATTAPDPLMLPDWAKPLLANWRQGLRRLMPTDSPVNVVVMDRRGAKMFALLELEGYSWGNNLWHSNAINDLSDGQLKKLFGGVQVVVFDEMVQHGRKIAFLRQRLEAIGARLTSVCLIRRRSHFLDGEIHDPEVRPVEDLDDDAFNSAATSLSRLLARRAPPMDVEHIVLSATSQRDWTTAEIAHALAEFGESEVVWGANHDEPGTVDAFTVDRPFFFDLDRVNLPDGISPMWDGSVKIRGYYDAVVGRIVLVFIAFPTLTGSLDAWRALAQRTKLRYGASQRESEDANEPSDFEHVYVDVCIDISLELLKQSVEAGLLTRLHLNEVSGLPLSQMISVFGPSRAKRLVKEIRSALRTPPSGSLFGGPRNSLPLFVVPNRGLVRFAESFDARPAVLKVVPRRWENHHHSEHQIDPITFSELIASAAPIDERSVSIALDYELDVGTVQPTQRINIQDCSVCVQRAYWRGEYDDTHLQTYDDLTMRRTRVVCSNALGLWLRHRRLDTEGELNVAKVLANLVHDWGQDLPPLCMKWTPYKFGAIPNLPPPSDRYLLPVLVKCGYIDIHSGKRNQRRYSPVPDSSARLFAPPLCSGAVTSRVKGLIRAYAAIQSQCTTVRETPTSDELSAFNDPLVVLASARNEAIAYRCALFELSYWIQIGTERLLPDLADAAALQAIQSPRAESLRASVKEFAQAGRFLYEKLNMYRHLPELRAQLKALFERESIDAGDIILDSIDVTPRFSVDLSETSSPIGFLDWAVQIVRPFASLVRQLLTETGYEKDARKPEQRRITKSDGTEVTKDARHYLGVLMDSAPELSSVRASLELGIDQARRDRILDAALVDALRFAYLEIVKLLKLRIPDLTAENAVEDRRKKREADLIKISRLLTQRLKKGYVAIGDFYNFAHFAASIPPLVGAGPQEIAERIQEWILQSADAAVTSESGQVQVIGMSADTVALAGSDAEQVLLCTMKLRDKLKAELLSWDREIGAVAIHYTRFGIAKFDRSNAGPTSALPAALLAFKMADLHGSARGSVAITQLVRDELPTVLKEQFGEEITWATEPNQGSVSWLTLANSGNNK